MTLIVMMAYPKAEDEMDEFDYCSVCSRPTNMLVTFRHGTDLCSLCGECVEALHKGYAEMLRRTLEWRDKQ